MRSPAGERCGRTGRAVTTTDSSHLKIVSCQLSVVSCGATDNGQLTTDSLCHLEITGSSITSVGEKDAVYVTADDGVMIVRAELALPSDHALSPSQPPAPSLWV